MKVPFSQVLNDDPRQHWLRIALPIVPVFVALLLLQMLNWNLNFRANGSGVNCRLEIQNVAFRPSLNWTISPDRLRAFGGDNAAGIPQRYVRWVEECIGLACQAIKLFIFISIALAIRWPCNMPAHEPRWSTKKCLKILAIGGCAFLFSRLILRFPGIPFRDFWSSGYWEPERERVLTYPPYAPYLIAVGPILIAPLLEEGVFRGGMLRLLLRSPMSPWVAVCL